MIRGNPELQAGFAQIQVPVIGGSSDADQSNGTVNGVPRVHIIDALLDLVIASPASSSFSIRLAACECIKAYFTNHTGIRLHFLSVAIDGHLAGQDETANVLTTLLRDGASSGSDPYRVWFSAVLLLHLIWNDAQAKTALMKVSEGDAENGEEVVTCIQTIAGNLLTGIERGDDERILIAYFMLLSCWLFEDSAAVNDFLGEASSLQGLMRQVSIPGGNAIVKGLSALLMGILYHYSTKDSPVPRRKLQPLLMSGMGREKYLQSLSQLRQHPLIRDYEVFTQGNAAPNQSQDLAPYAYFDSTFIEFFKDNFSKFSRAIDRDPGIEVHVQEEVGIDRDLVDSLRSQLDEKAKAVEQAESQILDLEQKLDLAQANHRKDTEVSASEIQRIKQINEALQGNHEAELQKIQVSHVAQVQNIQVALNRQITDLQGKLNATEKSKSEEADRTKDYYERSLSQARNQKAGLETRLISIQKALDELTKSHDTAKRTIDDLQDENSTWKRANETLKSASQKKDNRLSDLQGSLARQREKVDDEKMKVTMLEKEVSDLEVAAKAMEEKLTAAEKEAKEKEEARSNVQTELDDLLMILADLEKKRAGDKVRNFAHELKTPTDTSHRSD
jgi:intracellular protein transport protein USO1